MTITELIAQLEALRAEHGDLPVLVGSPKRGVDPERVTYYDAFNGFVWIEHD